MMTIMLAGLRRDIGTLVDNRMLHGRRDCEFFCVSMTPRIMRSSEQSTISPFDSLFDLCPNIQIAHESMMLLKNDGILPLSRRPAKIAVAGPLAVSARVLLGNYNGTPSRSTTALAGLQKLFPDAQILFEPGTMFLRSNELVPSSVLSTESGTHGLAAEVFANNDFSGSPVERRTDPQVVFGGDPSAVLTAPRYPSQPDTLDRLAYAGCIRNTRSRSGRLRQLAVP